METLTVNNQPFGVLSEQLNPLAVAVALDCAFVARGYAADQEHLKKLIKMAMGHKGFSYIDILQPCVSFNKINTYEWYGKRVYRIGEDYNPEDRLAAFRKALEWGDSIPIGVIYKNNREAFEGRVPIIEENTLAGQTLTEDGLKATAEGILNSYY